jgi:predicted nucleic acid-binding protein
MPVLIDTNVLARATQRKHRDYPVAVSAMKTLQRRGHTLCLMPQNLIELWNVCTRPADKNELGMSTVSTDRYVSRLERTFLVLPDSPRIFPEWRALVRQHNVAGASVHDARLVAAMKVHGVNQILTFDAGGFARYPGIQVIFPQAV